MKFAFSDKTVGSFNFEFARGLLAMDVGSAQIGECFETMERIRNNDFESWIGHWSAMAYRVRSHAHHLENAGDPPAAAKAFLRVQRVQPLLHPRHEKLICS